MTPKNAYSVTELFRLWAGGASYKEIAASLGVSESYVHKLKERHKLPNRAREYSAPTCDPTPEEIVQRAAECREKHYRKRRSETEDQTRTRVFKEEQACRQTSSQSRA